MSINVQKLTQDPILITIQTISTHSQSLIQSNPPNIIFNNPRNQPITQSNSQQIYGVRWSLSTYFSYNNLYKLHYTYPKQQKNSANRNYYILSFNSNTQIDTDKQIYVRIAGTQNTCTNKKISIANTNDHSTLQITNSTALSTDSWIYKCTININFNQVQVQPQILQNNNKIYKQYPYTIYKKYSNYLYNNVSLNNTGNRKMQSIYNILYQSRFRSPIPINTLNNQGTQQNRKITQKALVLGDWGMINQQIEQKKHYIPVLQSLIKKIDEEENIIVTIFLGDLAYDLILQKYQKMLKYIQPITSKIVFVSAPGNHDYVYHQDTFQLYAETFLSPQWDKYYNYYYTFIYGDVMFMSYTPTNIFISSGYQINFDTLNYIKNDLFNHQLHRLSQSNSSSEKSMSNSTPYKTVAGNPDPIYKQYHSIVFSHYPIFCAKTNDDLDSCQQNKNRLQQYLNVFNDIGMDLYMSGHLHYYQRMHSLCWDRVKKQAIIQKYQEQQHTVVVDGVNIERQVYGQKCPVYIVEGAAGNQYFIEPQGAIKPTNASAKIVEKTGFGILSITSNYYYNQKTIYSQAKPDFLQYRHYQMKQIGHVQLIDNFTKILSMLNQQEKKQTQTIYDFTFINSDTLGIKIYEMSAVLILAITIAVICFRYGKIKVGSFGKGVQKKKAGHVQMVQQNFEGAITEQEQNLRIQNKQLNFSIYLQ